MKKYQSQMVDVIAEIHDLYNRTVLMDIQMDIRDKQFIENLACTVELYFKSVKEPNQVHVTHKFEDFATEQDKKIYRDALNWNISDADLFE